MTIDYRGWGDCGGFLYFGDPVRWDDRLRFTQLTAKMRVRRGRIDPRAQVIDIRNAITFLQGQPGVDRSRIGVWGADLAGGHAIVAAGSDARVKAVVAQAPLLPGKDIPRAAFAPSRAQQADMVKLARMPPPASAAAAKTMNEMEEKLALAEYRPFWYLEQIRESTAVLFIAAGKDTVIDNDAHAVPAAKLLKGPSQVLTVPAAAHDFAGESRTTAANAAADWFTKHL
jgi:dienelactone hydrolase